jgi:hypothetical protein
MNVTRAAVPHRKSDRGMGPGQAVPTEQSEGHRSDVAASFAKPTSSHVIPGDKLDHDHTSPGLQVQVPLTDRCGCWVVVPTRSSVPWTLPRYGPG